MFTAINHGAPNLAHVTRRSRTLSTDCNQHISSHQSNNCWLKLPICCIRHLYHALGCTIPVRSPTTGSFTGKISWHAQDFSATLRIYQCSQDVCPPQDFSNPLRIFQRPQDVCPLQNFSAPSGFLGFYLLPRRAKFIHQRGQSGPAESTLRHRVQSATATNRSVRPCQNHPNIQVWFS